MFGRLTDGQLAELAQALNVTITAHNVQNVLASVQIKLLKFEIADEIERRRKNKVTYGRAEVEQENG